MSYSFFAEEEQLRRLSELGDSLEKLKCIDFERFRPHLTKALSHDRRSNAGRPSFDCVMMFKILVLKSLFKLSDDQAEYQITDRMSFQRFLGLSLGDKIPDAKTIWLYQENLTKSGIIKELFNLFESELEACGMVTHKGTIIDATFVDAPRQRNSREENKEIKEGKTPEEWEKEPHKKAQKDVDARWTCKRKEVHYGYKNHAKVDAESKLIVDYEVTSASVHDSRCFTELLDETDEVVYADSAYIGQQVPENIKQEICERGTRKKKLTDEQKAENKRKSKTRVRVEHVFGFQTGAMKGIIVRTIGIARARFCTGLMNLVYNFHRFAFLRKKQCLGG